MFGVTPKALDETVQQLTLDVAAHHGFAETSAYISKTGQALFVDVTFQASVEMPARSLACTNGSGKRWQTRSRSRRPATS